MTDLQQSIVEKVRKLLRHEDSARDIGNLEEAEAFAAKAQELLIKHKIEMSDVELEEFHKHEPVEREDVTAEELGLRDKGTKRRAGWFAVLLNGLGDGNFCKVISSGKRGEANIYYIIGRKSDRDSLKNLARYLVTACYDILETEVHTRKKRGAILKRSFSTAFKLGFSAAIANRLKIERKKLMDYSVTDSKALIRIEREWADVEDKTSEIFPSLRKGSGYRTRNASGYHAGYSYGSQIGLKGTKRLTV